jgi:predicted small lipoprotein YifL
LPPAYALFRNLLVVAAIGLAVSACGRRGALEPPPGAANAQPGATNSAAPQRTADDEDNEALNPSPVGQAKKRPRAIVIPKEPFILDPLL